MQPLNTPVRFFPVIEVRGVEHAMYNLRMAIEEKASGVFLCRHGQSREEFYELLLRLQGAIPSNFFVEVKTIEHSEPELFDLVPSDYNAVWVDTPGIYEKDADLSTIDAIETATRFRLQAGESGEFFGSVELSPHSRPRRLGFYAHYASEIYDVLVAYGISHGMPPQASEIIHMREHMQAGSRLAVAGGISMENLGEFIKAGATDFLVGKKLLARYDDPDFVSARIAEMSNFISVHNAELR